MPHCPFASAPIVLEHDNNDKLDEAEIAFAQLVSCDSCVLKLLLYKARLKNFQSFTAQVFQIQIQSHENQVQTYIK